MEDSRCHGITMDDSMVDSMVQKHASVHVSSMGQTAPNPTSMEYAIDTHGTL